MKRGPKPRSPLERVLARTERRDDGCLIFTGSITSVGYGQVMTGAADDGTRKPEKAHRVVYEASHGPIPAGDDVHHSCGTRACVELAHLHRIDHADHGREHGHEGARARWGTR